MNRSTIALAIAAGLAASAAAQAETTLYGSARAAIEWTDESTLVDTEGNPLKDIKDGVWDLQSSGSRLGVRGSEDLGNGMSAIYQFEFGVDSTDGGNFNSNRPRLVGLKGGFGALTLGTQFTPYYNVVGVADIFNGSGSFRQFLGDFRLDNSIIYTSPSWAGFRFEGMLRANGEQLKDGLDEWQATVRYNNGPVFLGGAYFNDESNDADQWALSGGLNYGGWAVSAAYEDGDNLDTSVPVIDPITGLPARDADGAVIRQTVNVDTKSFIVAGSYSFGNNILRAHYALADPDDFENTNYWAVGFQHNLSNRTRVWLEYFGQNTDTNKNDDIVDALQNRDKDVVSIGLRHDF